MTAEARTPYNPATNPRRLPFRARVGAPVFHLSHHRTEEAATRAVRRALRAAGMAIEADHDVARVDFDAR